MCLLSWNEILAGKGRSQMDKQDRNVCSEDQKQKKRECYNMHCFPGGGSLGDGGKQVWFKEVMCKLSSENGKEVARHMGILKKNFSGRGKIK